jgi:hypothetical protein
VEERPAGRWDAAPPAWAADVGVAVAVGVAAVAFTAAYGEGEPHFRGRDAIAYWWR